MMKTRASRIMFEEKSESTGSKLAPAQTGAMHDEGCDTGQY